MFIDCVVGTRPNFVKMAPILRALARHPGIVARLIHTGQHYDQAMDGVFFEELRLPVPDIHLALAPASGPEQVARMMLAFGPVLAARRPDLMIVVGDVNSTLAAALTASGMKIPLAHVEAGLRSFDRAMPEELNRMVVDQLSDLHFVTEQSGVDNLLAERVAATRIHFVGNVMIDSLFACRERAVAPAAVFDEGGAGEDFRAAVAAKGFGFVTLHRPSNVDGAETLAGLADGLRRIATTLPLVFAVHPRTAASLSRFGLDHRLVSPHLLRTGPLSYLRALGLMDAATVVITDSGGLQEEATALGTPCITVRDNTERPSTVDGGSNRLVGSTSAALERAVAELLAGDRRAGSLPPLWDGRAAERIAAVVAAWGGQA